MPSKSLKKQINRGMKTDFDSVVFYTTMTLVFFGIIMVFSASYIQSSFKHNDPYFFLKRDLIYATLGFIGMIILSKVDYKLWKKYATPICIIAIVFLLLVLTPLGIEANGAKRWLGVGGATFQPSDIAKFACVVFTAKLIEKRYDKIKSLTKGVLPILIMPMIIFILIMLEPNMSTAGTVVLVIFVMLFVAGMNMKFVGAMGLGGMGLFALLVLMEPYRLKRITSFLDPFQDPLGSGYQVLQSLYALGSGGLFGLGLGKSKQKYFYIPEPQNDFIFSIVAEELGFIGCAIIIILFGILIWRGILIAMKAPDTFGSLLATGIISLVAIQIILNIAVVTSSIPNTGISLPFFSYGGTALFILLCSMRYFAEYI